jgi:flagellar basal-body rod protein FlgC
MGYSNTFAISAMGMDVQRLRVDVAALNLANAHVAIGAGGEGFRPMQVVARSGAAGFASQFDQWMKGPAVSVEPTLKASRQVLEPGHPMADDKGFVSYPAVDHTAEMLTMMSAMRAYEANVAAMNMSRTMALKALDIGGAQ